jgi:hypothetical protein
MFGPLRRASTQVNNQRSAGCGEPVTGEVLAAFLRANGLLLDEDACTRPDICQRRLPGVKILGGISYVLFIISLDPCQ